MSNATQVTFHADGTVTFWDVYTQQWVRTGSPSNDELASLDSKTRARVVAHTGSDGEFRW